MPGPDAYVEMLKLKLDEWNDRIDTLHVLMRLAKEEVREQAEQRMDRLRTKRDEFRSKVKDVQKAGEGAGASARQSIEKVHTEMREAFDEVKSTLVR